MKAIFWLYLGARTYYGSVHEAVEELDEEDEIESRMVQSETLAD